MAGCGGKGHYRHTDIHPIHEQVARGGSGFETSAREVLPVPHLVEAFYVYAYLRAT